LGALLLREGGKWGMGGEGRRGKGRTGEGRGGGKEGGKGRTTAIPNFLGPAWG